MKHRKRILILGGGFGGIYTAMHLEKLLRKRDDVEITLVNRENYFVYQPMLAEVVGGTIDVLDMVSSIRKLLPRTRLLTREIDSIDIENSKVMLFPKFTHTPYTVNYDHLVISLGNVTDFRQSVGLHEHALPFKNLADALIIRNQAIDALAAAANTHSPDLKKQLLTFVVGGGGFSGTEVVAEINDFVKRLAKDYANIAPKEIKVILVHSKDRLMERELAPELGRYAEKILKKRGVEILFEKRLVTATPEEAILDDGTRILSKTIISTVPSSPNPLIEGLNLPTEKGRLKTNAGMLVEGTDNIWAIGDCAAIPYLKGEGMCPPTAQFAVREGKVLAQNIVASLQGKPHKEFQFKALGVMGALGHRRAVAEILGFKFSGIFAWFLWRMIYWVKLPGGGRKFKVALSWLMDTFVPIEPVQLKIAPTQGIAQLHFEPGEIVFHEGDVGDYLYIIVNGEVEVFRMREGREEPIATLTKGAYFGEMALLNQRTRMASVRCKSPVDVLALKKQDFGVLISNFCELRESIKTTEEQRRSQFGT